MYFISANHDQQDQQHRKALRRHVMLGKNAGKQPKNPKQSKLAGTSILSFDHPPTPVTRSIGSDLSLMNLADDVSLPLKHETIRFCTTMDETMYTLGPCISFEKKDDWTFCLQPLCVDSLYLNIMVFGSQTYIDMAYKQATGQPRRLENHPKYYQKSISLLRERLVGIDVQTGIYDAVIVAVFTLAMQSLIIGMIDRAEHHMNGLKTLVSMRPGGILSFRSRTKQMIELLR